MNRRLVVVLVGLVLTLLLLSIGAYQVTQTVQNQRSEEALFEDDGGLFGPDGPFAHITVIPLHEPNDPCGILEHSSLIDEIEGYRATLEADCKRQNEEK